MGGALGVQFCSKVSGCLCTAAGRGVCSKPRYLPVVSACRGLRIFRRIPRIDDMP